MFFVLIGLSGETENHLSYPIILVLLQNLWNYAINVTLHIIKQPFSINFDLIKLFQFWLKFSYFNFD